METAEPDVASSLEAELESLWRFALRLTANADDAADLVQKTCLKALEQRESYSAQGKFRSWLFRIQHRIWLNELRSRKIRSHLSLDTTSDTIETHAGETAPLAQQTPSDGTETALFLSQVCHAVDRLPEAQRLVMLLVSVEGFSYSEAADVLDLPVGTIMSRLARARVAIGRFQQMNNVPPASGSHNHSMRSGQNHRIAADNSGGHRAAANQQVTGGKV